MGKSELLTENWGMELDLSDSQSCQDSSLCTLHLEHPFLRLYVSLFLSLFSVLCLMSPQSDISLTTIMKIVFFSTTDTIFPLLSEIQLFTCLVSFPNIRFMRMGILSLSFATHCLKHYLAQIRYSINIC